MLVRTLARVALLAAVAGCASVPPEAGFPDVQRQVADRLPPPLAQRVAWKRGDADDQAAAQAVKDLLSHPLTADGAVQVALLNNSGLQATYEDLGVAQADLVQAGLLRNPLLSLATEFPTRGDGPPKLEFSVVANFLDLLWIPARRRVAAERFEQVKLATSAQIIDLAADTRAAYIRHRAALENARAQAQATMAEQAAYDLMGRLAQAGNVSERRLATEQAALEEARVDQAEAEGETVATRETLARLMGLSGDEGAWSVDGTLPDLPPHEPDRAMVETAVVTGNLSLAASRRAVAAKAESLGLAGADSLWSESALGVGGERETDRSLVLGPAFQLPLPLFDQGQPAAAKAVAEYRQEARRVMQTAVDLRSQAREAYDRLARARDLATRYHDTVIPLQERLVRLGMAEYNFMLTSPFEVMAARQARITAYRRYIAAVRDYWLADGDLIRLAGGRQIPTTTQPGGPS